MYLKNEETNFYLNLLFDHSQKKNLILIFFIIIFFKVFFF